MFHLSFAIMHFFIPSFYSYRLLLDSKIDFFSYHNVHFSYEVLRRTLIIKMILALHISFEFDDFFKENSKRLFFQNEIFDLIEAQNVEEYLKNHKTMLLSLSDK